MPLALVEFRRWCSIGVVLCLRVDAGCRIGLLAYGAMQIDSGVKVSGNDDVIVAFNTGTLFYQVSMSRYLNAYIVRVA